VPAWHVLAGARDVMAALFNIVWRKPYEERLVGSGPNLAKEAMVNADPLPLKRHEAAIIV